MHVMVERPKKKINKKTNTDVPSRDEYLYQANT